ncbi:MDR family MFS transporter [Lacisediminihabitans changchengi]|uniref:Multidrug efflux MFS transporter n=1 Tax=Lacisediminihabitans changchengi TaxID=2787634 RepID=A0A934SQ32_9MICO|nr:MDR family MFS transporter [Lacisediminihabitans changchengi]MBK4346109.1 multidrug efflux MFS transporter [Lacisediminihabitans changchengi]
MTETISTSTTGSPTDLIERDTSLDRRNRLVIGVLLISVFVMILNETIMGVALPQLMKDLDISASTGQWLTAAFLLTMAVVIPITGFLLQRFSTRSLFIAAMGLFSLGTLVAALSPGFTLLLAARVIQASGTAIMFPLLMTTVMTLVPPANRGRMMGNISIVISVAPAIGPTISGLILTAFSWRFMFIFVLPIALVALFVGGALIKNVTETHKATFDILSVVLSAFGFGGLVYGLSNAGTAGSPLEVWTPLAIGVLALAIFVLRQLVLQRTNRALLDLRTFRVPTFTFSIAMFAISMMAMFGTIVLLPLYMVHVLHLQELQVGLLLLPGGLVMGLLAPFVGRIYDRVGPRGLLIAGASIVSGDLWAMTLLNAQSSFWMVLAAHVTLSIGLALIFTPLFTASLGSLRPELYSYGSAMVGTIQQLAGAAGTALFVTVMSSVQIAQASTGDANSYAAGVHSAFLYGAVISLFAIPCAFFIRKIATTGDAPLGH